ncbi:coiled-coil domain-containing protein 55-domain containing protein [Cladorrhinum sp. PSN259]|nr:coiled-coil domain-containing protein 55-domain containing protein [Cladorrhinum sp. PSN259]
MSKPGFSFGLRKSGGPPGKPALLASRKKPTPFGGGDDDGSEDESSSKRTVAITELDLDDDAPKPSLNNDNDSAFNKNKSKKFKLLANNPLAPPPKAAPPAAQFNDLSSALTSRKFAQAAEEIDPTIYDYDAVYDSFKAAKAKPKDDPAAEKKPRYFDALQKAADQRERDHQIAEERRLKRERDAEGDEFKDKEKFVTEAYKRQQEENRRLEEEEKKREEEEAKKNKGRGMADFYKQMLQREEEDHAAKVKAAEEMKKNGGKIEGLPDEEEDTKTATERAREINALGGNVLINDDGEVVDKRQLLKGGLNVAPKKKAEAQQERAKQQAAAGSRPSASKGVYVGGGKQAMRERQTRMLEAQLEETLKRSRQEETEETAKIEMATKSRKTEADISSAKERYLARKRAAEEAKKNGASEGLS